jgi:membrane protein YqaA with SNARE-associated domain
VESLLQHVKIALLAFGPIGVLVLSVLDSIGVPLPGAMDGLVLYIAVRDPLDPHKAYLAAFMAVLGSLGGNIGLFWAARHGSRRFGKKEEPSTESRSQRFQQWFARYGLLTVFIPAVTPFVPFPLKVFVISAGAFRTNFAKFIVVILAARVMRYFGEAYLGNQLGEGAEAYLKHNAWPLLGVAAAMAMGFYVAIRLSDRRRETAL